MALSPESEDDAARYVPFEYGKVADLIDRTLKTRGSTISAGVKGFLEQYARTLRRYVMNTTDNIDELALQIYSKHRAAIDLIIRAKPALEARAWNVIDGAIAQHAHKLKPDHHGKSNHRYYAEELEDLPALKEGSGWTKSNRILLFEAKYYSGRLVMIIGPGPEATRRRIYDLVQKESGVPGVAVRRASQQLSKSYHIVYSIPLLGKSGSSCTGLRERPFTGGTSHREFLYQRLSALSGSFACRIGIIPIPCQVGTNPRAIASSISTI